MKRTIACFLACMLLIPGMFVYASAEEDSIFTYDDSKAYVPNVILLTFRYNFDGGDYPDNYWGSGAFGDVAPLIQDLKLLESYDVVENDTRFTYRIYQLTLIKMYQHDDLIDLAAHLAEVVRSVALVNFPHCVPPRAVSLVEKAVVVEDYRDDIITGDNGAISARVDLNYVARDYPWSVEDFPELDVKSVQAVDDGFMNPTVKLKLNDSSKESLVTAVEKLAKRYEFTEINYTTWDGVVPIDPVDSTTIPDETTVPVADIETTVPTITDETIGGTETTGEPDGGKPTSPQTGDAGRYAACVCAVALLGVAGVVIYRKRRSA